MIGAMALTTSAS